MSPDKMIHMANQIAAFFKTQPGNDQAERIAAHLTDYWEPRMRSQLCDHVARGGEGLDEVAVEAVRLIS